MGYFAGRAAPLGAVGPGDGRPRIFFNFHPAMVRRALPDAWSFADPTPSYERPPSRARPPCSGGSTETVEGVSATSDPGARAPGRASRRIGPCACSAPTGTSRAPDDPVEALWQGCTCLREHRGDGHVAALTAAGLDGCEALVLFALSEAVAGALFRASRGDGRTTSGSDARSSAWPPEAWSRDGEITSEGASSAMSIEATTDRSGRSGLRRAPPDRETVLSTER